MREQSSLEDWELVESDAGWGALLALYDSMVVRQPFN